MSSNPRAPSGRGIAFARTALAGNPSDGYGGAVLATTFANFQAEAHARRADAIEIQPPSALVSCTVGRFARELAPDAASCVVRWCQRIPREVGLGSSSGLVIATLRALCDLLDVSLTPAALAALAHAIEREDLGVSGGRQDQVAQAHDGLVLMEFGDPPSIERLDPGLLPPLLMAYRTEASEPSGQVHEPLRERFAHGETAVLGALDELAALARHARDALIGRDHAAFARCVDASFDVRARMMPLHSRHVEMVHVARRSGASANYSGSGGAIVCVCEDDRQRSACAVLLRELGCETVAPRLEGRPVG